MNEPENIVFKNKTTRKKRDAFAIFDFDWTIVKPKDGRRFPKDKDDWQWLRSSVCVVVKRYYQKKYKIVFVTDQTKEWKIDMIKDVVKELNIPITALIAMKKDFSKPNPQFFLENFKDEYDNTKSFYVGDAAGRDGDWSEKDKVFATNIGVQFYTPEEIFPLDKIKTKAIRTKQHKEVIIMIGYPGSGKTTIAKSMNGYIRIDGDALKTPINMIKEAEKYIGTHSVIFDATNPTKERRALFIDFAKNHNVPVRCIWISASIDTAMEQNKEREIRVPDVVFYVFRKKFEEPTNEECEIVRI